MRYLHNIVIFDNETDWFGSIGTQICGCYKHLKSEKDKLFIDEDIYGYISLELEDPHEDASPDFECVYILCNAETDFSLAYNRCCDAILDHPRAIDLRGLNVKILDESDIKI